jgi:predicted ester cyclase
VGESETIGAVHGRDGARQLWTTLIQAFPDLKYEVEQMIASGDHVVIRSVLSGTHQGNFAGTAPTHKKVSWGSCTIVEIRNGKAVRTRTYADSVSLLRQTGVLPVWCWGSPER